MEIHRVFKFLKLLKLIAVFVLFLFFQVTLADAAQSQRYDIAYTWGADIQRVLDYRKQVATLLELTVDNQLKIVGRGQEYGVVYSIKETLEQAKKTAGQHTQKLRRAGLKPAHVTKNSGYHSLYNVSYTLGPNLEILKKDFHQITSTLGKQVSAKLFIEKVDSQNFSIVYHCWGSKSTALRYVKQHGSQLKTKKISPTLISAVNRPIVEAQAVKVKGSAQKRIAAQQAIIAHKQASIKALGRNSTVQAIPSSSTARINSRMDSFLQGQKKKGRICKKERTAWVAYDLTNNTYVVSINTHRPFQAASMIKPFVALAFFHQVDRGKLSYTPQHRRMMEAMIQQSSNPATNWFIRQVGGPARCEAILKKEYGRFFNQVKIKEFIPSGGRTYKNTAPPSEYIQFLKALWNHQLPHSKEMLRVMSLPGRDRIYSGTEVPRGTLVYNKTGSTAHLIGDMGILAPRGKNGQRVPYAIVGIVESPSRVEDYKQWMQASGGVIRDFSTLVYEEMKQKHNLL